MRRCEISCTDADRTPLAIVFQPRDAQDRLFRIYVYLGLVVGMAMIFAITVAAGMGVVAPAFFKRIGIDPAIAAAGIRTASWSSWVVSTIRSSCADIASSSEKSRRRSGSIPRFMNAR